MNECIGFWGKIFGHKFVRQIVKEKKISDVLDSDCMKWEFSGTFDDIKEEKEYVIYCKRCGVKFEN